MGLISTLNYWNHKRYNSAFVRALLANFEKKPFKFSGHQAQLLSVLPDSLPDEFDHDCRIGHWRSNLRGWRSRRLPRHDPCPKTGSGHCKRLLSDGPILWWGSDTVDQIGRFISLWATFQSLWNNYFPKLPTFLGNFCKGVKVVHFSSEINFGQLFTGHTDQIQNGIKCLML